MRGITNETKTIYRQSNSKHFKGIREGGITVSDLCRKYGISSSTFYKWREKYSGMDVSMLTKVKELEAQNSRLNLDIA